MRLKLGLIMSVMIVTMLSGCGTTYKEKLYVLNWGEYIDLDLIQEFEKANKVDVVYNEVDSNEAMYTKLVAGGTNYDIAVPGDYMVERLISENRLFEINKDNIPNLKNIDPQFLNKEFDPNNKYSIPYFFGTIGIMYNTDLVDTKDLNGWSTLWNKKYKDKIVIYDSLRDTFGVSLKRLGYSMNERDEKKVKEAASELEKLMDNIYGFSSEDIKNMVVSENVSMGLIFNGDYLDAFNQLREEGEDINIGFYIPSEGTNLWIDNMVIPKTSKNKEMAEKFINFMQDSKNALRNTKEVGYSTPNLAAYELLKQDPDFKDVATLEAYYPTASILERSEVYINLQDANELYDTLWTKLKSK